MGVVVRSPEGSPQAVLDAGARDDVITRDAIWSFGARLAVIGIFLIMFGGVLVYARAVLLPVVTAIVIGTMLAPLERRAANWHVPAWLFALAVVGILMAILQTAIALLSGSIIEWIQEAPKFADALGQKLQYFTHGLSALRDIENALSNGNGGDPLMRLDVAALAQTAFAFATPALGEILIFFATLFFFLFSRRTLRRYLILAFEHQDARLRMIRVLNEIEGHLTRYLGTVTLINAGVGLIAGVGAQLLGLPNALLIGTLAFVCNYVPYIGPALVIVILFGQALIAPLLYAALTTIEGHFVTPNVVGQRLTLNPFAVFLALTIWTWLWGPVGAFLSVPFLIVALVVMTHFSEKDTVDLPG